MTRLDDIRRRLRGTSGRGRKIAGLAVLLKPYRWRASAALVALVAGTAASLAPAPLAARAIDDGIIPGDVAALDWVVAAFILSALVYWAASFAQTYLVNWVGQRALQDLREQMFRHLQSHPVGFYERNRAGMLLSRMTNDVEALDSLVTDTMITLVQASLTLLGTIVILLVLDVKLALLTFAIFPVMAIASLLFRIASADAYRRTRETIGAITAYLQETLSGIRVVRTFGQEPAHLRRFSQLNEHNRDANMTTVNLNAAYFPSVELLSALATVGILLFGGFQALNGNIEIGVLVGFIAALNGFFDPINQLSQVYTTYQSGMAALDKIFELLDTEPELVDAPDADELPPIRGEIRFDHVTFSYRTEDDERVNALTDVDLVVPPGQTLALVGSTGAGKSTFAKLVARFYDPTEGRVLVDGHDLRDVRQESLRAQMGIVPQEGFLFSGTLRENLGFGRDDVTRRGDPRRLRRGRRRRLHPRLPRGPGHPGRRARRAAVGRPAPARRLRPRADRRPAHPGPRRGDLQRRPAHRDEDRDRPAPAAGRPHRDRHRPPPVDHPAGRPHHRDGARPHRRAGHPRRAPGPARALLGPLPRLGRAGRGLTSARHVAVRFVVQTDKPDKQLKPRRRCPTTRFVAARLLPSSPAVRGRLTARRLPLEQVIGVRIPAPQLSHDGPPRRAVGVPGRLRREVRRDRCPRGRGRAPRAPRRRPG